MVKKGEISRERKKENNKDCMGRRDSVKELKGKKWKAVEKDKEGNAKCM